MNKPLQFAVMLVLAAVVAQGGQDKLYLRWDELADALAGATLHLRISGVTLQGQVISTAPESMQMIVERSSDTGLYPRGGRMLPRERIESMWLIREQRQGKAIGTMVGTLGALEAVYAIASKTEVDHPALLLIVAGGGILGHRLGKRADTIRVEVVMVP